MIDFLCPKCDADMSCPEELAGKTDRCPVCKAAVRVPRRSDIVPAALIRASSDPPVTGQAAAASPSRRRIRPLLGERSRRRDYPGELSATILRGIGTALIVVSCGVVVLAICLYQEGRELRECLSLGAMGLLFLLFGSVPYFALAAILTSLGRTMIAAERMAESSP